jgi:hypothetical protein
MINKFLRIKTNGYLGVDGYNSAKHTIKGKLINKIK